MIIVSRIIHVKVDRRLNVTNKFKYQRRLSSRLAIVMFRGTPCMYKIYKICKTLKVFLRRTENVQILFKGVNSFNIRLETESQSFLIYPETRSIV